MNRRTLLKRAAAFSAAATVPACTPLPSLAVSKVEISNRIHDLAWEIADLLKLQGEERYVVIHQSDSPTSVFVGKVIREA